MEERKVKLLREFEVKFKEMVEELIEEEGLELEDFEEYFGESSGICEAVKEMIDEIEEDKRILANIMKK